MGEPAGAGGGEEGKVGAESGARRAKGVALMSRLDSGWSEGVSESEGEDGEEVEGGESEGEETQAKVYGARRRGSGGTDDDQAENRESS